MSDLILNLLNFEIGQAGSHVDELGAEMKAIRNQLADLEGKHAEQEEYLRALRHVRALVAGESAEITVRDIQSSDDTLGMLIGPLGMAPPDHASVGQLAAYAETMRALVDQANHQVVLATGALNEHRANAAPTPPEGLPVVQPAPAIQPPALAGAGTCIHCGEPIQHGFNIWTHSETQSAMCRPDDPASPYAEPADPFDIGPDPDAEIALDRIDHQPADGALTSTAREQEVTDQ